MTDGRFACASRIKGERKQHELVDSALSLRKQLNDALPTGSREVVLGALEQIAKAMESWPRESAAVV